jgi:hypothetical protein
VPIVDESQGALPEWYFVFGSRVLGLPLIRPFCIVDQIPGLNLHAGCPRATVSGDGPGSAALDSTSLSTLLGHSLLHILGVFDVLLKATGFEINFARLAYPLAFELEDFTKFERGNLIPQRLVSAYSYATCYVLITVCCATALDAKPDTSRRLFSATISACASRPPFAMMPPNLFANANFTIPQYLLHVPFLEAAAIKPQVASCRGLCNSCSSGPESVVSTFS